VQTNSAGLFATDVGPIDSAIFAANPNLILEIQVRDTGGLKPLSPRQKLSIVPFAARADSAGTAGTADIAAAVQPNSIGSQEIKPESITSVHLASAAVTSFVLAAGAVNTVHLASGAVTDEKIQSVSAPKISGEILDAQILSLNAGKITGALTAEQIGDQQITDVKIDTMSASKLRGPLELETINALSSLKFAGFETLKILQVVSGESRVGFTTTSSAFVDTPVTVTITPKMSTSKILLFVFGSAGSGSSGAYYTISRDDFNLGNANGLIALAGGNPVAPISMMSYDAPDTLKTIRYTVKIRCDFGSGTSFPTTALPDQSTHGTIFAIELGQ
jgi:hypothetical protein